MYLDIYICLCIVYYVYLTGYITEMILEQIWNIRAYPLILLRSISFYPSFFPFRILIRTMKIVLHAMNAIVRGCHDDSRVTTHTCR